MSAYILTAAPVVCFIFINVAQPHYYCDVLHTRFIQIGLGDPGRAAAVRQPGHAHA